MARIISASIDLAKIDKKRIVKGKAGQLYYNIDISVNDEKNQYDQDCSISQQQTKEERQNKANKVYLGNGKTVWSSDQQPVKQEPQSSAQGEIDDLPF